MTTRSNASFWSEYSVHRMKVNGCPSLWASDAENYMYDMDEEYTFARDLESIFMDLDSVKQNKLEA